MDSTTGTNVVGKALELQINEDCANHFMDTEYTYTGRVFTDTFNNLYYEMTVTERGFKLLKPVYAYPMGNTYMETTGTGLKLMLLEG